VLDARISLAFAVHSNPGAYAVLIGSGVSRAAEIPTGWEVVLDLIDRVAQLCDADTRGDPVAWFRERYEREPDYSVLLEELAAEPAERQRLLRAYFEPDDDDREQGKKMPTAAHHAIAQLVRDGAIKVIVTTNFDRLLERALDDVGIVPTVLATADAIEGAMPLAHTQCTIVKVHGDYLDARIRNTPEELAEYDARINGILDRIFDEYGLIVCGWSGEWDTALRGAIARCPTRRFTTFWSTRGDLREQARELVELRRAVVIEIENADSFLVDLQEKVKSLEEVGRPHPLSAVLAKATLKRYLAEDRFRIRLHDLFAEELKRVENETTPEAFPAGAPQPTRESGLERIQRYEAICETLMALNAVAGYWGEQPHRDLLVGTIQRLATRWSLEGGFEVWTRMRDYPTLLALYAAGLGASAARRLETLAHLLGGVEVIRYNEREPLLSDLIPGRVINSDLLQPEGGQRFYTPVNDRLAIVLREPLHEFVSADERWEIEFDRFEYLFSVAYADVTSRERDFRWAPVGSFGWRRRRWNNGALFVEIEEEARAAGDAWPFLQGPLFGGSLQRFLEMKACVDQSVGQLHWL
jgi:SIR2-like domain